MVEPVVIGILVLAVLACVGWLGGGRKWAFRTVLAALALVVIGVAATLIYIFWTDKAAERRAKKVHECAIAKVADPKCTEAPKDGDFPKGAYICPLYTLGPNPTPQQEEEALSSAEQECRAEVNPKEKSLHEQLSDYKRQHVQGPWTKYQQAKGDIFDQVVKDCAGKVRKKYPSAYDDLNDETLVKKVLAKYPHYCSVGEGDPPGWEPVIENIR
jgi:hypothetical protein